MNAGKLSFLIVVLITTLLNVAMVCTAEDVVRKQLRFLPPVKSGRFDITGRKWPEKIGEALVCLWEDDKLAAFSFTIDDNCVPNHDWWVAQGKKYGFSFTWFVITGRISEKKAGDVFNGTWDNFRRLIELGHDVQSHTVQHRNKKQKNPLSCKLEYVDSKNDIEKHIKGHNVLALAYPGGGLPNDNDEAMNHYAVARGVVGHPNVVNMIDYTCTRSVSKVYLRDNFFASLPDTLKPGYKQYRGWYCVLYHFVNDKSKDEMIKVFDYLKNNEKDFWVGRFLDVGLYGQERDTAKLKTIKAGEDIIMLSLSDDMADDMFIYPLTIKIRVSEKWQNISAMQMHKKLPAEIVKHGDKIYVLVKAVPDKGAIILSNGSGVEGK